MLQDHHHATAGLHLPRARGGELGYGGKRVPHSARRGCTSTLGVSAAKVRGQGTGHGGVGLRQPRCSERRSAEGTEAALLPAGRVGSSHLLRAFAWFWIREP